MSCGAVLPDYKSLVTATDNCTASPTITQTPAAGTAFTSGMTVTMRATDASGNFETCSFVVNASADTTKPTITCPGSQSLTLGSALPDYRSLVVSNDNCDVSPTITQSPAPGSIFNSNGTTVTMMATDDSGNFASCTFIINNSSGDLPPVIECPSDQELFVNSTLPNYVFLLANISDDITDAMDMVFTQTPPQGTLFTADTNVTITAKDVSDNVSSCSFLVKVKTTNTILDCKSNNLYYSNIDGKYGFTIYGEKADGKTGFSVSTAGDVNGDGIDDFLVGAPGSDDYNYGKNNVLKFIEGAAYLVFGNASGFPPNIDLALLNGTNGFKIRNDIPYTNFPNTGFDVSSAGDINGDGITDFMVSDPYRHTSSGNQNGNTYVVFGRTSGFPAEFFLSSLDGTNGFTLIGAINYRAAGRSISSVEDVNGDGTDDIAIVTGGSSVENGKCYVLYGKTSGFPAQIKTDQINGTNGFVIEGDAVVGKVGNNVAGLGDINGDGFPDIGLGSYNGSDQHRKYVVYGRSTNFPATINVASLNGSNGFILENTASPLGSYYGVSRLGDINGDGYNDLVVHESYVLFGSAAIPAVMDLKDLNGINGFKLLVAGKTTSIGDLNKDGIGDFGFISSQTFYAIYGKSDWTTTTIDFTFVYNLKPSQGFKIGLKYFYDYDLSFAGDVNKDGIDDVIIGNSDYAYDVEVNHDPGYAYVIYGKKIEDTEKPVITNCPANKVLAINDLIPDYTKVITVTDNCDDTPIITQSPVAGTVFDGVSQEVTLTVTDASGNVETCKFNVSTTADTEAPVVTCPTDQQLACGSVVPDYLGLVTVNDNSDPSPVVTQSPVAGNPFTDGMTVSITAKDASGNESDCSFKINASADVTKPVITCIGNQILSSGDVLPDYSALVTATDNCDAAPIVTQSPVAGSAFVDGMTVSITAKDASGNTEDCSFLINETADTEAPLITCLTDQSVDCSTIAIADYTNLITVTDNKDINPIITQSPVAGNPFTNGMTVTITAKDASGNESDCSFKINASADVTKPVITCIGNQILSSGDVLPDYSALVTATDNCDAAPIVTQSPVAGSAFVDGMTVSITAKDASGNTEDCSFLINETADTEAPLITCLTDQSVDCSTIAIADYTNLITVTDNKDINPIITQSPVAGNPFTNGMTITITAKDASGNESGCSFKISASADVTKPVITCIGSQSLSCSSILPDYTKMITATDNCDAAPVITQSPSEGSPFTDGMTITITAKDASGNESDCIFKINVSADVTKPVITCIGNQTLAFGDVLPDYSALVTATDNCDAAPIVTQNPVAGSAFTDGMTVVISATDASGNTETCSFVITAIPDTDTQAPVIICLANQQVSCSTTKVPDYTSLISITDNKDPKPTVKQSPAAGSVFKDGMTVTITATDASSNKATCSFKINSDILLVDAGDDIEIKQGELVQLEAVATEEGSFKWTPTKGVSNAFISNPFFSPVETTTYTVSFTNKEGCEVHDSVIISVEPKEKDETKYGFSPNNDGINDVWVIHDITKYPDNEVSIYNSWGDLVFQAQGYNNSNNVFSGIANKKRNLGADMLPEGTYFFEINPNAASHHFKKLKGYLVLKR